MERISVHSRIYLQSILFVALVAEINAPMDLCHNTEVVTVASEESDQLSFECICGDSSTDCSWSTFTDRRNVLSSGNSESLFMWQRSIGYGQYICVENSDFVRKDVLILPQGEKTI